MKVLMWTGIFSFLGIFLGTDACARSSNENARIVNEHFPREGFERWFALATGDELPQMRDDLIRRKNRGENFFRRVLGALSIPGNWKLNHITNNDDEIRDPYNYSVFQRVLKKK